jgi:small-conductance mechanosensitive channel
MDETKVLFASACKITLALALVCSLAGLLLFHSLNIFLGIWIGAVLGLIGLQMIVQFARTLSPETKKSSGFFQYSIRYAMYAIVFFACAYKGIPVLSLLAGFLCSKLALFLYSLKTQKGVDTHD